MDLREDNNMEDNMEDSRVNQFTFNKAQVVVKPLRAPVEWDAVPLAAVSLGFCCFECN